MFDVEEAHLARSAEIEALDGVENDREEWEADCYVARCNAEESTLRNANKEHCYSV
jgi:hypothetical protein